MPVIDASIWATLALAYLWLCCFSCAVLACIVMYEAKAGGGEDIDE